MPILCFDKHQVISARICHRLVAVSGLYHCAALLGHVYGHASKRDPAFIIY